MPKKIDCYASEAIPGDALSEIQEILATGDLFRYTSGRQSPAAMLEEEFAEAMGVPFALAVNSCSSALFLSLRSLGLGSGSRVLIPAFTFAAVPSAIVHAGCVPVLVNVGSDYRLDIEAFEARLAEGDIDAVMISHMRGHTSDMDAIVGACEARGLPLIEDSAHSLGARWGEKKVGTLGRVGCFSFQSYKLLNAGEGGILITEDAELIAKAVIMSGAYEHNWRKHPLVSKFFEKWQNRLPLYNMRMNNLSAAVLRPQLKLVEERSDQGRYNHDLAAVRLNLSPWIDVPSALPKEQRAPDSIQFNLVGFGSDGDVFAFKEAAASRGVDVQIFGLGDDNARAFWNWKFIDVPDDLAQTRAILTRACDVRLPTGLSSEVVLEIAEALVEAAEDVQARARLTA